jgi:tetratricopeptide (TPR) repeat protein
VIRVREAAVKRALIISVGVLASFAFLVPPALAQLRGVRGTVVDTDGAPMADAVVVVEVVDGNPRRYELTTGEDGKYIQLGLEIGLYRITAEREGYAPTVIDFRIKQSGLQDVPDIALAPAAVPPSAADLQAMFAKGVELAEAGKLDEAEATYLELLEIRSDVVEVHQNLGYVYMKREDWASAEASYLTALDLRPGAPDIVTALARLYRDTGQEEKARELLSQIEGDDTPSGRAQFNKGIILLDAGNSLEARTAFEAALAAESPVAEAHYHLGTILVGQGKVPEAVEHLEAYLATDPEDGPNKETAKGLLEALK